MTKTQKVWLGVFLGMFIVPEIIVGPLTGIITQNSLINFLPIIKDSQVVNDNPIIMNLILASEIFGLGALCIFNFKILKNRKSFLFIFLELIFILILIFLLGATYLYNSFDNFFS